MQTERLLKDHEYARLLMWQTAFKYMGAFALMKVARKRDPDAPNSIMHYVNLIEERIREVERMKSECRMRPNVVVFDRIEVDV